jgi:3-hydroxybutyryl-CoA dehydratase
MKHLITEDSIVRFCEQYNDNNLIHLDEDYAKTTKFGTRIAPGMHIASYISGAIAEVYPGCIYISQNLDFMKPVYIDDTVEIELKEYDSKGRKRLVETTIRVGENVVLRGCAGIYLKQEHV